MKASELMPGGIVLYEYEGHKTPAKVFEIYRDSVLVEDISGEYEPIEIDEAKIYPIEITPEILKKNGFRHGDGFEKRWYDLKIEDKKVSLYQSNTFYTLKIDEGIWTKLNNIYIRFVHELQHALRLCGIDKSIEL